VTSGVNGLRAGGAYLAIGATARCSGPYCRRRVPFAGEQCEGCKAQAAADEAAFAERDAAEDHRTDDSGWREARRA
jgi:hypothetical protein